VFVHFVFFADKMSCHERDLYAHMPLSCNGRTIALTPAFLLRRDIESPLQTGGQR